MRGRVVIFKGDLRYPPPRTIKWLVATSRESNYDSPTNILRKDKVLEKFFFFYTSKYIQAYHLLGLTHIEFV